MSNQSTYADIAAETLQEWLERDDVYLVDVRPSGMHEAERIAGSRPIPVANLELADLNGVEGKKLVMQCQIGVASVRACHKLRGQGWQGELFNLAGGITEWKKAGLPTEGNGGGGGALRSLISKLPFGRSDQR